MLVAATWCAPVAAVWMPMVAAAARGCNPSSSSPVGSPVGRAFPLSKGYRKIATAGTTTAAGSTTAAAYDGDEPFPFNPLMMVRVVAAVMMMRTLNNTGFKAFQLSVPSPGELLKIFEIAAPVFITMTSKVAFYSLLTYFATSMGTTTGAAHQVMINVYCMCTVWGEPLSQTAQSFMPELIHGLNRSLLKARALLKSLVVIGAISGVTLGIIGTSFPWFSPIFSHPTTWLLERCAKWCFHIFYCIDGDTFDAQS